MAGLRVYFEQRLVGTIDVDKSGPGFVYDGDWIGLRGAFPISTMMPLKVERIAHDVFLPWAANLLPENEQLRTVGQLLGMARGDVIGLLSAIGGDTAGALSIGPLEELQLSDLDRLLWMYLRMLYSQHMLERFFENTSADQIQAEVRRLEDRIKKLEKEPDSANRSRIRQSLQANLETCRSRLANLDKARENHELLQAEIENLETKIQSVTELAINRSDSAAITGQVEQITQGLIRTEQTINDLGFATGAETFDLTVPSILPREVAPPAEVEQEQQPPRRQRENEIRYQ